MPEAIVIRQIPGKPGQVWYPLEKKTLPPFTPSPTQVVIRISAAALNHRDLFLRQHLYPGMTFGMPLLADGAGVVIEAGSEVKRWIGKRVVINPGTGWTSDPDGPEGGAQYAIVGGTRHNPAGCLATEMVFEGTEVEEAPAHLSDVEAAALPLTGLTAWRAVVTKSGNAAPGRNILVTGIGGGVAIMATLFAVARGANVYVSSGSQEKIEKAMRLGAKGGVNYREKDWEKKLVGMLPEGRKTLDAIIDGAGGDIVAKGQRILKAGGVIVSYGMTVGPKMDFLMGAVLKNIEIRGSTMGSRKEFADMVKFVDEKKLKPVISRVVQGLDLKEIDGLFDDMKAGSQFGKLVVELHRSTSGLREYSVIGRHLPSEANPTPKLYRMRIFALNDVIAKSRFWYFLAKLRKVKKANGEIVSLNEIHEKKPQKIKNFGVWIRYDSRSGTHNMYKEYRTLSRTAAIEALYLDMASKHRARFRSIHILKVVEIEKTVDLRRPYLKQLTTKNLSFPLPHRVPKAVGKKLFAAHRPSTFY